MSPATLATPEPIQVEESKPAETARPILFEDEGLIGPIFTNPFDFEFD